MAKITQVATDEPSIFEGSVLLPTYWCCEACGELVTPDTPAIARWPLGADVCSGFEVLHKGPLRRPAVADVMDGPQRAHGLAGAAFARCPGCRRGPLDQDPLIRHPLRRVLARRLEG